MELDMSSMAGVGIQTWWSLQVYVFPRHLQVQYPELEALLPWWVPDSSSQSFRMGASEYGIWCKTGMGLLLNFPTMDTTTVELY